MPSTPLVLENELLRVTFAPERGGKITSLRSIRTGEEFILPPLQEPSFDPETIDFSKGDLGGFDECLPSVSACGSIGREARVPDHGDLWSQPWTVEATHDSLLLQADASSRPLRLTRRATLDRDTLLLDYEVVNTSAIPATWLWSAHPLLQVEAGDRIILPPEITEVDVEYAHLDCFKRRSTTSWPVARTSAGHAVDLAEVGPADGVSAFKLFARLGKSGVAQMYRARIRQGIAFRFDPAALPFLGIWICSGAWPAHGAAKQYTVALEPTTTNYDSLAEALTHDAACHLNAGEHRRWTVALQLLGASSDYTPQAALPTTRDASQNPP